MTFLWKEPAAGMNPEFLLGEFSGGVLQFLYFDILCCCNVSGADCSGICDPGTSPLEVDVTPNMVPEDAPPPCTNSQDCNWLEGKTFRLQQDAVDPCQYCHTIPDWCADGTELKICFFFWFEGRGGPGLDASMGRLQFKRGGQTSQVEWEIGIAPVNCGNYVETVTDSSTAVNYGPETETTCDWFGAITGRGNWSYTVDAV